jgi:hypothetical protein
MVPFLHAGQMEPSVIGSLGSRRKRGAGMGGLAQLRGEGNENSSSNGEGIARSLVDRYSVRGNLRSIETRSLTFSNRPVASWMDTWPIPLTPT